MQERLPGEQDNFTGLYRLGEPRRQQPVISYRVETLAATRGEALPLLQSHYDEIAQFKDVQKLDPDWEMYDRLEQLGRLWVMTVRDRGTLVGYMVMVINRALHYRTLLMATEDIHYLLPHYRRGMTGYRLIRLTLRAMRERGCRMAVMRCKAANSHAKLFERLDGELSDLVYAFML
jgi:L-amino acid N-acyltransferase YncA